MTVFVPHYEDKVRIKDEKQKIRHMVLSCGNFVYVVSAASTKLTSKGDTVSILKKIFLGAKVIILVWKKTL